MSSTLWGLESKTSTGSSSRTVGFARRRSIRTVWRTASGVVLALLFAELALRPWNTLLYWVNARPVAEDSLTAPPVTVHTYDEGCATAHFTRSCARLTGNPPSAGAPYILIVGDSFVAAVQVPDRETMGAEVESLSEREGHRVNIRQYGWIAAGPAKYIVEAPQLRAMWRPALTVAILNLDDFVPEALDDRWTRMHFNGNGPASIERVSPDSPNKSHALARRIALRSALVHNLLETFSATIWPRLTKAFASLRNTPIADSSAIQDKTISEPDIIRESVHELHRAYGDNLLLIYASEPGLQDLPDPVETTLLANCKEQSVDCLSTRVDFIQARNSGQFLAAGFGNSQPGAGHYNADGHRLIAQDIWRDYRQRHERTW